MIDIDPQRLFAWGLSARDVNAAIGLQNVVLHSGTAKMGENEYPVLLNSNPAALDEIGALPIKTVDGKTIYLRDIANIRDGNSPQQSMVRVSGQRSVLMSILKNGSASTLDVAARIRSMLPATMEKVPKELSATLLFDQSLFVRAAVDGVVHEALIAAGLTAAMMQEIAVPAFVSTLCICIVFVPVMFIAGAAKSLFVPLALAVVFAMAMSYILSRTLVPTLVRLLLEREAKEHAANHHAAPKGLFGRIFAAFNDRFDRLRTAYGKVLAWSLAHRPVFVLSFLGFVAASVALFPLIGRDFFPRVDAGLIKLHVRGAAGTRREESEHRKHDSRGDSAE